MGTPREGVTKFICAKCLKPKSKDKFSTAALRDPEPLCKLCQPAGARRSEAQTTEAREKRRRPCASCGTEFFYKTADDTFCSNCK